MTMESCKLIIIYRILFLNIFIFQCSCESSSYKDNVRTSQDLHDNTIQSEEQNMNPDPGPWPAPVHLTLAQYNKVAKAGGRIRMNNMPTVAKRVQLLALNWSRYETIIDDFNIQDKLLMFPLNENVFQLKVVLQTNEGPCAIKTAIEILAPEEHAGNKGGGMTPEQWAQACSTQSCVLDLDWQKKCDKHLPPRNAVDNLPIHLTKDQYNRIVHARPRMMMHNVPNIVKQVKLSQYGDKTTTGKYESLNDTYVFIPKMDVTKGTHKLMATLITPNETVCATKLVIEIHPSEESMTSSVYTRTRSIYNWVNQCTVSCIIDLDWKNKCDVMEKPHDRDSTEGLHTASSPGPNIDVTDNPFNHDEPTLDADKPFEVGDTVTYTCESKERVKYTTIQWIQKYNDDNTTIVALNATAGRKYKLVLQLQDFDYNTNLKCIVHTDGKDKEVTTVVSDFNTILKTIPENFPTIPYTNISSMNFTCGERDKTELLTVMALIRGNKITKFDTNYHLTKNDNGSILCCLQFLDNNRKSEIQRNVHKKSTLIYQESAPHPRSGLAVYSYVGVAVMTILVSVIAFAVVKRIKRKKVRMLLSSQEVDNHPPEANEAESKPNLYSNVTLYAELDLASGRQSDRRPVVQDTTYAEITSPNTVLYAQLDLPDGKQNAQVEESPYAQIRDFS